MSEVLASIELHFRSNFFPPLPVELAQPAAWAVDACIADNPDCPIGIDKTINMVPRVAVWSDENDCWMIRAGDLVRVCKLDWLVEQ